MPNNILLPSQLKVVTEEGNLGIYEIEGLYPGYGHTLGNSLRRIILSSLPGSAVTAIKIEGADHEFATMSGIKEDVLTMVLNIKKLRFKLLTDEPQTISLRIKGEKEVTAADIESTGQVEVLNPDQYIATVTDKKTELNIDFMISQGLGFVPRKITKKDKVEIGEIALDAIFTPIRRVSYDVENMRVGDRTDHNRLRVTIETDGTLSPREALEQSVKIMIAQLRAVLNLTEDIDLSSSSFADSDVEELAAEIERELPADDAETVSEDADNDEMNDVLKTRIDTLELSTRTLNALSDASIRTVGGLVRKSEDDLLALDGIGEKGVEEIKSALQSFDITLKV